LTEDASRRAELHRKQDRRNIFIAQIDTSALQKSSLKLVFLDETVNLPIWESDEVVFISTRAIREHLRIDYRISQESEWFALEHIPSSLIIAKSNGF
jgi:hypothetical protein